MPTKEYDLWGIPDEVKDFYRRTYFVGYDPLSDSQKRECKDFYKILERYREGLAFDTPFPFTDAMENTFQAYRISLLQTRELERGA